MTQIDRREPLPNQPSPLAVARAEREVEVTHHCEREMGVYLAGSFPTTLKLFGRENEIAEHARTNQQLLDSRGNTTMMGLVMLQDAEKRAFRAVNMGFIISAATSDVPAAIRILVAHKMADELVERAVKPDIPTTVRNIKREFNEAEQMAQEYNLPITEIYRDDETYKLLEQRATTPTAKALEMSQLGIRLTPDVALKIIQSSIGEKLRAEYAGSPAINEVVAANLATIANTPEVRQEAQEFSEKTRAYSYLDTGAFLELIWGEDALDKIPKRIKASILFFRNSLRNSNS